jgi:hypothetical protein
MPFLIAPGHIGLNNVKMGAPELMIFSRFFNFFGRISIFRGFFERFWKGPISVSAFSEIALTAIVHVTCPKQH